MESRAKITINHQTIKRWILDRNGKPAMVRGTADNENGAAPLRINFPDYEEENLEDVDWDTFFKTFDNENLKFIYREETKAGFPSRFFKFINK